MATFTVATPNPQGEATLIGEGMTPLLARVLAARGLDGASAVQGVLNPLGLPSYDPFLLPDMDRAVERIGLALSQGEKMAVFGDYDVDGITSTCLLTQHLQELGGEVVSYIPKRFGEGYGLNNQALESLHGQGVSLVITVDCGISGYRQVEHGNGLGLDLIITDHHSCPAKLPPALAVVNPRREDSDYPFDKLAGVGVALKLVQALSPKDQWDEVIGRYCDLVAVGTVADVMPLVDENRYLVALGLEKLNQDPLVGLAKLLEEATRDLKVTATTIGFTIAPRVNAAGRLDETHIALELLLTQEEERGRLLAQELCALNGKRQAIEGKIVEECLALLEENPPGAVVFLWREDWHPGVLGIVASRLAEKFHRPAFILCSRDGVGKGSCRSYGKVDLYQVLTSCKSLLLGFGGHAQAAGFTAGEGALEALKLALEEAVEAICPEVTSKEISVDGRATALELNLEQIKSLEALEPCGAGCPRPSFLMEGAEVRLSTPVGEGGKHLRVRLAQGGAEIDGIYFHYRGPRIFSGQWVDLAFYPRVNAYRGTESPQIQIFALEPIRASCELLLEKLQEKGDFSQEEAGGLLPERNSFVLVWHWLKDWRSWGNLSLISQGVDQVAGLAPGQGQVCLAVFLEGGLVALDDKEGVLFPPQKEKADLEQSPIIQHLQRCHRG